MCSRFAEVGVCCVMLGRAVMCCGIFCTAVCTVQYMSGCAVIIPIIMMDVITRGVLVHTVMCTAVISGGARRGHDHQSPSAVSGSARNTNDTKHRHRHRHQSVVLVAHIVILHYGTY